MTSSLHRIRWALSSSVLALALVAVVPVPASAGLIPPPGMWPTNVTGATNPLVGTPFAFNGGHATPNAELRVWLPSRGRRVSALTRTVGYQTRLEGRLRNRDDRHSIAGATLTIAQQDVYRPDWTAIGNVQTDRRGYFRASIPAGYHRRIAVLYYPAVSSPSPVFSRRLLLRAKSRVALARPFRAGRSYRFDGQVTALNVPPPSAGLLIALQVRNRSGHWITARLRRTTPSGRFRIRYKFPSAGALRVRVFAPAQSGWPFYAGASGVRVVRPR
jgi:hypothetical protein